MEKRALEWYDFHSAPLPCFSDGLSNSSSGQRGFRARAKPKLKKRPWLPGQKASRKGPKTARRAPLFPWFRQQSHARFWGGVSVFLLLVARKHSKLPAGPCSHLLHVMQGLGFFMQQALTRWDFGIIPTCPLNRDAQKPRRCITQSHWSRIVARSWKESSTVRDVKAVFPSNSLPRFQPSHRLIRPHERSIPGSRHTHLPVLVVAPKGVPL
jgi:hypothetical protein